MTIVGLQKYKGTCYEKRKKLEEFVYKVSKNDIMRLRESYKDNKCFENYLFKKCKKIFRKLMSPYVRFEVLQNCVCDIIDNTKYYPDITTDQKKKINLIFKKLQKICVYLNLALEEYTKMVLVIKNL